MATATRSKSTAKNTNTTETVKSDIYETITNKIVEALDRGVQPWVKSWKTSGVGHVSRPLRSTGEAYNGINVLVLWIAAEEKGYNSPFWFTFNQAKELKAFVKKGEKGTQVVYASTFTKEEENAETGETDEKKIPFLKSYVVFNAEQIEGLPEKFYAKKVEPAEGEEVVAIPENIAKFFENTKVDLRHGGDKAYFNPHTDHVQMPIVAAFNNVESYLATLSHEMIHWTGSEKRVNRLMKESRFGSETYAMEELVAELGSAFLCADLGITNEPREDHASYIGSWIKALKNDKRAIFTAASAASKAAEYLHGLQTAE